MHRDEEQDAPFHVIIEQRGTISGNDVAHPLTVMAGLVPAIPILRSAVLYKSGSPAQGR
jgi:hypothetical protein